MNAPYIISKNPLGMCIINSELSRGNRNSILNLVNCFSFPQSPLPFYNESQRSDLLNRCNCFKVLQYYEMSCFSNLGSHCHLVDSVAQTNSFLDYFTLVVRKAEPNPQSWPILYECLFQLFNTHLRILFCCACWFRKGSQRTIILFLYFVISLTLIHFGIASLSKYNESYGSL